MTDITETSPPAPADRRVSAWWRLSTVCLFIVLAVGWAASASMFEQFKAQIGHLQAKLKEVPQVHEISVLLDGQQKPALLVTFDPTSAALQLQRLNQVKEGPNDSMQLWAIDADEHKPPRSLGLLLGDYKTLQVPAKAADLEGVAQLAISVEDKGGVPDAQGPRLPYLFKGWLVRKAL
ncbi:MAG: anti-sigma factor [Curvibacter sp.]|nr:anti-sigma factor [Curvibacter sp.]